MIDEELIAEEPEVTAQRRRGRAGELVTRADPRIELFGALKTIEQDEAEAERKAVEAARRKHKIEQKIAKKERRRRREIEEFCQVLKETLEK